MGAAGAVPCQRIKEYGFLQINSENRRGEKMAHKFTYEQVKEAIDNSDYTYKAIALYLAEHFTKKKICDDETAKKYVIQLGLEPYLYSFFGSTTRESLNTISLAIKKGDVKTSKWWVERMLREQFGNEVTVHQKTTDPLNINLQGELFSEEELKACRSVEVANNEENEG